MISSEYNNLTRDAFENGTRGWFISVLHMEVRNTEYPSSGVFERSPGRRFAYIASKAYLPSCSFLPFCIACFKSDAKCRIGEVFN